MKRLTLTLVALGLLLAAPAQAAEFGLTDLEVTVTDETGAPALQAGSHPFALGINSGVVTEFEPKAGKIAPVEEAKDVRVALPAGFIGAPEALPRCSVAEFLGSGEDKGGFPDCANATVVGIGVVEFGEPDHTEEVPIYNLEPSPGKVAKLGLMVIGRSPVVVDVGLSPEPPYEALSEAANITQTLFYLSSELTIWGVPADPAHDDERGDCLNGAPKPCDVSIEEEPFLTLPTSCGGSFLTRFETDSWLHPGAWLSYLVPTNDQSIPPNPLSVSGCSKLDFSPEISSRPTTAAAESGSGLDFELEFSDPGLTDPDGYAQSQTKKAVITLPKGVTVNPSVGEGLSACSPADLKRETVSSEAGDGCPNASKIGTLHVETPLVDEDVEGQIFLAQQDDPSTAEPGAENPFDSLIALYFVLKNPDLGVIVKQAVKVEPDPQTGQLLATIDDVPQVPFSHFSAHLRTGERAALITPSACGTYTTKAELTPWSNPTKATEVTSAFQITSGVGGGPCPQGGIPPFNPRFEAGSVNNNAGSFSPFNMRLQRADGEQDMTKFSSILPPGQLGSLAGVEKCPDAAVAIAKAKSGREELASPSCPQGSKIGRTLAGAGVGEALTYVPGSLYLAGPYNGDPLSVIAITPAVAGPFDAGTVAVRLALNLNPRTAEVEVDGANSDPIPHILKGIVLKLRDLRVYVDRPNFTLNPTSCEESSTRATLFGSFLDVFSPADDVPASLSSRYQAANCAALGFKPRLAFELKGGTSRGAHPALKATYRPRKGDANLSGLVVRLPRSAFLDQAHIRTICTRVQFAAEACPKAAQYGFIEAFTPLLDEPLKGPVWLRSSNHNLPDLVFDLQGLVDVEVSTRIDSKNGGIRASIEGAPDAPIAKVILRMQGAKKGLIVNSRNLCAAKSKVDVQMSGQNGKRSKVKPLLGASCGKGKKKGNGR